MFFKLDCKESTFGFLYYGSQLGTLFLIPSYEQNNFNLWQVVHGSLRAILLRKNWADFQNVTTWHIFPRVSKNFFYQHDQPKFQSLEKKLNIEFKKFSVFELVSELEKSLLLFDDSCEEIFNDKKFSKLATAGRHRNISVIYVNTNCFNRANGIE